MSKHHINKACFFVFFFQKVGDNQCLLQSLKDSPYYQGFIDKATIWETRLADMDEYLHNLNQIQRKWVYLEPIFGRGALPREQDRFKRVDDDFRYIVDFVTIFYSALLLRKEGIELFFKVHTLPNRIFVNIGELSIFLFLSLLQGTYKIQLFSLLPVSMSKSTAFWATAVLPQDFLYFNLYWTCFISSSS